MGAPSQPLLARPVAAALNAVLAYLTNVAAGQYRDARVVLISLAFLASAGFLGLHALATPGVLLPSANVGFAVATPVGLIIASVFAAASMSPLAGPRARTVLRLRPYLLGGLLLAMVAWAVVSILRLPPLDGPPPAREGAGLLDLLSVGAVALYVVRGLALGAALPASRRGTAAQHRRRPRAPRRSDDRRVTVSRNWHASWWEWHLLLLAAFASIALGARREYRRGGSLAAAFGGLYLEATLSRVDRWYGEAVSAVVAADARGQSTDRVLADLRRDGASDQEITLLAQAAREVGRLDAAFRPYLPTVVAQGLRERGPEVAQLGGQERVVSVLFADLAVVHDVQRDPDADRGHRHAQRVLGAPSSRRSTRPAASSSTSPAMGSWRPSMPASTSPTMPGAPRRPASRSWRPEARPLAAHPGWPTFRAGVNTGPGGRRHCRTAPTSQLLGASATRPIRRPGSVGR